MTGNELNYLFKCMDRDRNGSIDFAEFGELILRHRRLMAKHDAFMTYFLPIDADEPGINLSNCYCLHKTRPFINQKL